MAAWREHRKTTNRTLRSEIADWMPIVIIAILCAVVVATGFHF